MNTVEEMWEKFSDCMNEDINQDHKDQLELAFMAGSKAMFDFFCLEVVKMKGKESKQALGEIIKEFNEYWERIQPLFPVNH